MIIGDANPSGIEWNSRTQDLSNPSLLKIRWAYHDGRPAPKQQGYKPTQSQHLHLETSKRSINSQQRLVNSLKSWKFNQEPRLTTKGRQKSEYFRKKKYAENYSQDHLYSKPKTLISLMGHI